MCGILGIAFQNGSTMSKIGMVKYVLRGLLAESESRGSDATGVAFVQQGGINVIKDNVGAKELIGYKEFSHACIKHVTSKTISILGHCRFKTKGTPEDNNNNHPIVTDNIVGVHNGVIINDDALFEKFQRRFKSFKRKGRVDSEIIFRLIDHYVHVKRRTMVDAIGDVSYLLQGDFACALVDRTMPYMLWLFRSINPIIVYNYPECGVILFASNQAFIDRTIDNVVQAVFGDPEEIYLLTSHCLGINLKTNSIYKFELKSSDNSALLGIYDNL